jgi:hypothetical protein
MLALMTGDAAGVSSNGGQGMLWTVLVVLVVLWLLGFVTNVVGSVIHLLLVIALVVLIAQLLSGRRTSV